MVLAQQLQKIVFQGQKAKCVVCYHKFKSVDTVHILCWVW